MNETQEALCVGAFKRALREMEGLGVGNLPDATRLYNAAARRHAVAELPKPGPALKPETEPRRGRPERPPAPTTSLFPPALFTEDAGAFCNKEWYDSQEAWYNRWYAIKLRLAALEKKLESEGLGKQGGNNLGNPGNLVHVSAEGPFHDWCSRPPIADLDV